MLLYVLAVHLFVLIAKQYSIINIMQFVMHSSADALMFFSVFLSIMNIVTMNICKQMFIWTFFFFSSEND